MDYLLNQRFLASWSVSSQISTLHIGPGNKKWSSWVATIIKSTTKIFNYQTQAQKQAMRNHNCLFIKAKSFCLSTQFRGGEIFFNPWLQINANDHHKYSWTVIPCVLSGCEPRDWSVRKKETHCFIMRSKTRHHYDWQDWPKTTTLFYVPCLIKKNNHL